MDDLHEVLMTARCFYFNSVLIVHHVTTGEGNSEDAVIILQQQQGEGWAEVF